MAGSRCPGQVIRSFFPHPPLPVPLPLAPLSSPLASFKAGPLFSWGAGSPNIHSNPWACSARHTPDEALLSWQLWQRCHHSRSLGFTPFAEVNPVAQEMGRTRLITLPPGWSVTPGCRRRRASEGGGVPSAKGLGTEMRCNMEHRAFQEVCEERVVGQTPPRRPTLSLAPQRPRQLPRRQ